MFWRDLNLYKSPSFTSLILFSSILVLNYIFLFPANWGTFPRFGPKAASQGQSDYSPWGWLLWVVSNHIGEIYACPILFFDVLCKKIST